MLINGTQKVGIKKLKSPKAFIDYSQTIEDAHEHVEKYNPAKKSNVNSVWRYDIKDER